MIEEKQEKTSGDIDDPWEFVLKAARRYKKEFRKTAKIGSPPKIDDIIEKTLLGVEEEEEIEEEKKEEKATDIKID